MKTKVYTTGQILSAIAAVVLGGLWFMSQRTWDVPNPSSIMVLAVSCASLAVGMLCFRNLVYNKNEYELLEQFPVIDQIVSTIGAALVFAATISISIIGILLVVAPLYEIVIGMFA